MIFHPAQSEIAKDTSRFRVVCCGRRFGKTSLAIYEIAGKAYTAQNRKICYIAPTYQQARDIAWVELVKVLAPITSKVNESRLEITVQTKDHGKSMIFLRGWESVETLRGQAFDFLVIDEIASMRSFDENWNEILRPTLTDRKGEVLFISTPKGFNHFYDLFNMQNDPVKGKDYKSFHYTSYDNPHLPPDELNKAKAEMTEDQFAQEYLADFRKQQGLVYKEFDRNIHLYDGDVPRQIVADLAGVDFGFTNPAAVVRILKDSDNHYWVAPPLFYRRGQTDANVADYVKMQKFNVVFPDPENPAAIKELTDRSVNIREVQKGKDSVRNGISKVRELLKQNRLHIHVTCKPLIEEIESYHYPDSRSMGNEYENPVKENDHACFTADAYIDFPLGKGYIVPTGKKVVYKWMGTKVTADHPFLTKRGFVRFDALRYDDILIAWSNKRLMELSLGDIKTRHGVSFGTILFLLRRNVSVIKQNDSIGIYGKSIMGRFLKRCISITRMAIHLITIYLTSNVFPQKNTVEGTTMSMSVSGERIWKLLKEQRSNGIRVKKEENFIKKSQDYPGKIIEKEQLSVMSVEGKELHRFRKEHDSALIIAKLAPCAPEEVYAVVTSSGFYSANGAIVSNCDALRYVVMTDDPYIDEPSVDFSLYSQTYR